jgi:hypothetical protein
MHSNSNGYADTVVTVKYSVLRIIISSFMPIINEMGNAMHFTSKQENHY